ncbi:MAG: hypothetical protein ACREMX_15625 [Gemmatimonadales bacterium]
MMPFATFALLYMTALFLELAEKWTYPLFTSAILLLVVLILRIGITRITFLIFLAVTSAHFLLVQFPDVANHVNVAIYCNLLMMLAIGFSLVRIHDFPTDDECYQMLRPVLQASMILVYFLAGFHKLNADFVNPDVSCVRDLLGDLSVMTRSDVAGIPTALILAAGILPVAYRLLSASPIRRFLPVVVGVGAIGLLADSSVVLAMAGVVIVWELIGGPLLAIPRLQAPLLAFSWAMHATLALIGFVDFGALALSLLFTFVPRPYLDLLSSRLRAPVLGLSVHRAHVYFAISVLAGIVSGFHRRLIPGMLFNAAALVFIWPLLPALVARPPKPAWAGVALSGRMTPRWMFVFPVLLVLHGLTSYLGLRTAGNFSMFSNLRTEGARSNHFLLGGNPLKLWSYQEDVVRFIRIDDRRAKISYQYQPLQGNNLPVVEFRKLIYAWTRAGATIPMTFEYRGRVHSTDDIANDPGWRTDKRDWQMALLDFRAIQPDGPNRCRW